MKKNRIFLVLAALLSVVLIVPAILLPTFGADAVEVLTEQNFDSLDPSKTGTAFASIFPGNKVPSTAKPVKNPVGDDQVLKIDSKVTQSGDIGYDYIIYSNYTRKITWADDAKTSGTFTIDSTTYTVASIDGGKNVSVNGSGSYATYRDAGKKEANDGGNNVDVNLAVAHKEISYADYDKVVMQVEYFIPEGAKGSFESQQLTYKYMKEGTTSVVNASYLNLYAINLATGRVSTGDCVADGTYEPILLDIGQWNTISLVLDLDTGAIEYYVNNVLAYAGRLAVSNKTINITNITLNQNKWNVAKLNKQSNGTADSYAGCIYLNNAIMHTMTDSMKVAGAADEDVFATKLTLRSGRVTGASPVETYLANVDVVAEAQRLSDYATVIAPVKGASMRLRNTTGLRFGTQLNTTLFDELVEMEEKGVIADLSFGTLITPYEYVVEAGDFTIEALEKLPYGAKYLDVDLEVGEYFVGAHIKLEEGYDTAFTGSIIDIRPGNRSRLFTGMGYVKITQRDGTERILYSYDYADAATQETNYARSVSGIASVFVNTPNYAPYRDMLLTFMEGMNAPVLSSTSLIKNVQYSPNEFFFQTAAGVACQLVYDGNNGWRFQAVDATGATQVYDRFLNIGAAQALSLYLGEEYDDLTMRLNVAVANDVITLRAEGTDSYVTLNVTGSFNLQFFSANGTLMNNVTAITTDGTNVTLTGDLLANEAIYGGGERFDAVNKRGKQMELYTYDAYNTGANQAGTYVAIPLFTSSRGSGIYVNRYEYMTADWGKASANKWSISIRNNLIDCYFYSTGKMTDAIKGYTDLSGHATLPEEWAQGLLVCRYSPDLNKFDNANPIYNSFEEIPGYENLLISSNGAKVTEWLKENEFKNGTRLYSGSSIAYTYMDGQFFRTSGKGNPAGYSVKYIVENLIAVGMKPTAMVLEGMNWTNIANGNNYNNLVSSIEWLEEQGIKTTLYMGIANIDTSMPGYKEEYQLKARISNVITVQPDPDGTESGNFFSKTVTTITHDHKAGEQVTYKIPKTNSNTPDAIGSSTQDYLDITNPAAVDWYINVVWKQLIDLGVDGIKIDFCEEMPEDGMEVKLLGTQTVAKKVLGWVTSEETTTIEVGKTVIDYLWYDESVFAGDDVHHAFPTYFISMFYSEMSKIAPDGFVVLSRGGGIGSQRNPYMWAGDQVRDEMTLTTQLNAVISSGLSGLPFMTYDMAGYAYAKQGGYWGGTANEYAAADAVKAEESEIFARAIQYTAFSLMIQTHGDVRNVYELTEEAQEISRNYYQLHQDLMGYIQKYSQIACDTGMPVLRHMVLRYQNDANVYDIQDQYMFGDALLIAPILELGVTSREVYLPKGEWLDCLTGEIYKVGAEGMTITVNATLEQIPVFMDVKSGDVGDLSRVFNGEAWQWINGGVKLPAYGAGDGAYGDDIFFQK